MKHYPGPDMTTPAGVVGLKQRLQEGPEFDEASRLTHVTNDLLERVKEAAVEEFCQKLLSSPCYAKARTAMEENGATVSINDALEGLYAAIEEARK